MPTLNHKDFERILRKFADDPDDVLVERDTIVCQINGESISITLSEDEDGVLFCQDADGIKIKARRWIEKRLAGLDELASKILQAIPPDPHFITVGATQKTNEQENECTDTVNALYGIIKEKNTYATETVYLLSEAGDGKTCIMEKLAQKTAQDYQAGTAHFIFLPVSLGGRPFLRIDDLVIGILANKYRFRKYYFDAIIELVKYGFIVLGLDGFEEMVVEGKEDNVISSLGELLTQMDSAGKLIISARRAFFDYALKNQAPLVNSIRNLEVDFSSFRLLPWGQKEFCDLLQTYQFSAERQTTIYEAVSERLSPDHPILTRPVLARKLVEILSENNGNWKSVTSVFSEDKNPQVVIDQFVRVLLHREATEKWLLDAKQLLSVEQHFLFLQELAEEMWLSNVEYVKEDYLFISLDLFSEENHLSPSYALACKNKIAHHAMLYKGGNKYFFCHEAFRQYILGKQIATYIIDNRDNHRLSKILSQNVLQTPSLDAVAYALSIHHIQFKKVFDLLTELKGGISKISPISQNVGGILLAYWKKGEKQDAYVFSDLFFSSSSFKSCNLNNITFNDCSIEELDAVNGTLNNVCFNRCSISSIAIPNYLVKNINCTFDQQSLPAHIYEKEHDEEEYSPSQIINILTKCGSKITDLAEKEIPVAKPREEILIVFCKIVKYLCHSSGISGSVLSMKFGSKWGIYKKEYLPIYLEKGLLESTDWQGRGSDDRYRLGFRLDKYETALKECDGSFDEFVKLCK